MDVSIYYRSGNGKDSHRIDVAGVDDHASAIQMVAEAVAEECGGRKPGPALFQRPFLARIEGGKK